MSTKNNRYRNTKQQKSTERRIVAGVATVLAAVLACGYVGAAVALKSWNPVNWFEKNPEATQTTSNGASNNAGANNAGAANNAGDVQAVSEATAQTLGGMVVGDSVGSISLTSTKLKEHLDYNNYAAGGYYALTVSNDKDVSDVTYSWYIQFSNSESEWASGKSVTDYVYFEDHYNGQIFVYCLQAFGEQIIITVKMDGTDLSASCVVDYVKIPTLSNLRIYSDETKNYDMYGYMFGLGSNLDGANYFNVDMDYSDSIGTVEGELYMLETDLNFGKKAIAQLNSDLSSYMSTHNIPTIHQKKKQAPFNSKINIEPEDLFEVLNNDHSKFADSGCQIISNTIKDKYLHSDDNYSLKYGAVITCYFTMLYNSKSHGLIPISLGYDSDTDTLYDHAIEVFSDWNTARYEIATAVSLDKSEITF